MSYSDATYLVLFLPLTILIYNLMPQKHRWKVLLIASYIFFWSISKKLIIFIIFSTFSIHHFGLWLKSIQEERNKLLKEAEKESKKAIRAEYLKKQRKVLLLGVLIHLGILLVLKYSGFALENLNALFTMIKIPISFSITKYMMPIGISFYTLQAISYITDVYHEKIQADRNLGRLALFMTFFPQIMEGPICRYSDTAMQLWEGKKVTYQNLKFGLLRIGYGIIKKIVIADRLNIFVQTIFEKYSEFDGGIVAIGVILYTVQLYMDFSGVMDIVIGSGEIFGIKMPENFRQPFFSKTISEFWTRWHITLGAFFRDYVFYPLSLSEPLKKLTTKARKKLGKHYGPLISSSIALFCVWFCNGLWHGAAWSFIFFGMYHFVLILTGNIIEPLVNIVNEKLHIKKENWIYKTLQIIRTTILVFIGELFFEAKTVKDGFAMLNRIFTKFSFNGISTGAILDKNGMDLKDFIIVGIGIIFVYIISILKEKNVDIKKWVFGQKIVIRWLIYYAIIFVVIILGAYGMNYIPVDPMYAGF